GPDVPACLAIAQQAEAMGFDFLYASENLLNCIHGPAEGVADAWSIMAAIAATTNRIGLCGAIKPGFRSPFLVARMLDTLSKIGRRRLALNIVCGWWKTEFELSGVQWLDHQRRYDRADAFLRSIFGLFRPAANSNPETAPNGGSSHTTSKSDSHPTYGLDEASMPEVWIAGHSDRAIELAAEWGDCLFLNGMNDADLRKHIQAVRQAANHRGRTVKFAVNAYVVAAETSEQARDRVKSVMENKNAEIIEFFRGVMDQSGAAAWSQLSEEQMIDSNAGFELGLIGSFDEIRNRIPLLAEMGIERIVCQFDDPMRDAGPFMKRVIRPLKTNWAGATPTKNHELSSIHN
ncbi:MAG: LLM class flavin-dependent oxidoreductase, partial [Proteobacteria bacterium]|nr:LLM class flavin-dependent oxidoreductase [Pseudomonadota bacterium]